MPNSYTAVQSGPNQPYIKFRKGDGGQPFSWLIEPGHLVKESSIVYSDNAVRVNHRLTDGSITRRTLFLVRYSRFSARRLAHLAAQILDADVHYSSPY